MTLLCLDTIRGPHSTGVLMVNSNRHASVHKELGTPWELQGGQRFERGMAGLNNVLMGHNRYATKGAISAKNAHPFTFNNVIGAHNGTLVSQYGLDDYQKFEVDSENLYHHMNNNGVEDTIAKLNGAFALTWYDREKETMNMIRNTERTLYTVMSKDRKTMFWASEDWMLIVALRRAGIEHTEVAMLPPMELLTIPIEFGGSYKVGPLKGITLRKLEGYRRPQNLYNVNKKEGVEPAQVLRGNSKLKPTQPFSDYTRYIREEVEFVVDHVGKTEYRQSYIQAYLVENDKLAVRLFVMEGSALWHQLLRSPHTFTAKTMSYVNSDNGYLIVSQPSIVENVVEEEAEATDEPEMLYLVYRGREVNEEEFDKVVGACGCAWCSGTVEAKHAEELVWLDDKTFVCPDCQEQKEVFEYLQSEKVS